MGESITTNVLRLRRQELARAYTEETKSAEVKSRQAEEHWLNVERFQARIDEIDELLASIGQSHQVENVILLRKPVEVLPRTKPSQRYRTPCATTDIVAMAYATPGIEVEQLITSVYEKYKDQGTSRDTINKMVNRLIREKYASKRRGRLMLEDVCKRAWESSPLYRTS